MEIKPSMFIGVHGGNIISFGSGQPDLPPPENVFSCLSNYREFKYGLIAGETKLRDTLAKQNPGFTKDNFVITNGASEALDLVLRVVAKPGEKVLLHKPYYYSYKPLIEMNNLKAEFVETEKGKIIYEDFEEKVHGCSAVLINSPCNPTGRIQDISTLKKIEKITKDLDIPLISDEVYKELIYERDNYFLSGPHVVTVNSFSKTFSMCGHRVGYFFSNDLNIVKKVIELKTHSSMNTSTVGQEMAYQALISPKDYIEKQRKIWQQRRDFIYKRMLEMNFDVWKPEGAFYIFPKIDNPKKFVLDMFQKHDVITYLGEWFGDNERVRFSYALSEEKIEEGLNRVKKYLEK